MWVWSQEDDIDQMELRVAAIMQAFNVSHDDLLDENGKPMLYLNSGLGKGKRLNLAKRAGEKIIDGEHLADLMASAKAIGVCRLFIIDGAKALSKVIRSTFGRHTPIQRCQIHKARNVIERLRSGPTSAASSTTRCAHLRRRT